MNYTDEIEKRAGWLTPATWLFAHLFYRHKQRRWKMLIKEISFYRHKQRRWKMLIKEISCAANVGRGLNISK